MTLHEQIRRVSEIITPYREDFYNYVLFTSDNNGGFLRTRYCWWDKPIADRKLRGEHKRVIVACNKKINIADLVDKEDTAFKLQFHYDYENASLEDAEWDVELGYNYIYLVDLDKSEFVMEYLEHPF